MAGAGGEAGARHGRAGAWPGLAACRIHPPRLPPIRPSGPSPATSAPETGPAFLDSRPRASANRHWNTLDLNGDGRPDLVSTGQNMPPLFPG
ncbi:MAG: VCBS repeat-containing protein [bacterium]